MRRADALYSTWKSNYYNITTLDEKYNINIIVYC